MTVPKNLETEVLMSLTLVDFLVQRHPECVLMRRFLEGDFLNETTMHDILVDPVATRRALRLAPGAGAKAQDSMCLVVRAFMAEAFPDAWEAARAHPEVPQPGEPAQTDRLRQIRALWRLSAPAAALRDNGRDGARVVALDTATAADRSQAVGGA